MAPFQIRLGFQLPSTRFSPRDDDEEEVEEEDEEEEEEEEEEEAELPISSPLILPGRRGGRARDGEAHQFSVVAMLVAALRRSLVMCSVGAAAEDGGCPPSLDIGWPTDVRHIAHVTFDRFDGFLGLPVELEPELPRRVPSASASVFGVSANSMQCSYDKRGSSVPTILLSMQRHLYLRGGLQVEGIFRINAENSQEIYVRDQLNRGVVPDGVDLHCLAGLIKAWFRELPTGVLDSLTPDQVMHCNNEEECSLLAKMLPPMEAALLDWVINLMADVVKHEQRNKMNARNIAMVFAPNMTQMADPLTALIHAVQVMNFLKTLILKTLRRREEAAKSCFESPSDKDKPCVIKPTEKYSTCSSHKNMDFSFFDRDALKKFLSSAGNELDSDTERSFGCFEKKGDVNNNDHEHGSGRISPLDGELGPGYIRSKDEFNNRNVEGSLDRFNFGEGVRRFCRHPVFHLSRSIKKSGDLGGVDSSGEGRQAWV